MALGPDQISEIQSVLDGAEAEPAAVATLRDKFPDLRMTRCDQSDVDTEDPYREYPAFNLYLVDGSDHCSHLTDDASAATGIVIAKKRV